jgi:glycosyltransferase involved in cell wall biosynthesis
LAALQAQTMPAREWELLLVDNASDSRLAETWDISWHPRGRHVREERLGLTLARLRGIAEATGDLLVFADDDNVLAPNYLLEAITIRRQYPHIAVFGAAHLDPDFEIAPPAELHPYLSLLTLRTVHSARWSNNAMDFDSIPWGAGLCVSRSLAERYGPFLERLDVTASLGRKGKSLFSNEDDVFSWLAIATGSGFGIFPELRLTHLIAATRLNRAHFLRLIRDHAFSGCLLHYRLMGIQPRRIDWTRYLRLALRGLLRGSFAMRCRWAECEGEARAARFIDEQRLQPITPRLQAQVSGA